MKTKALLFAVLYGACLSTPAFATGTSNANLNANTNVVNSNNHTTNINKNRNWTDNSVKATGGTATGGRASSRSNAAGGAGGIGQGGTSSATSGNASASVGASSNSLQGGAVNVEAAKRGAYAPALGALPSGPCTGASGGLSIGLPGWGGGIQAGGTDDQCTLRENIRTALMVGDVELARAMLRQLAGVEKAEQNLGRTSAAPRETVNVASGPTNWNHTR